MEANKVTPDYRIVKVSFKRYCDAKWIADNKIDECGVFYLVDANLHVHICSLTPNLEAWAMIPYVTFTEELPDDGGERITECEGEMTRDLEPVDYYGTDLLNNAKHKPLADFMTLPEPEDHEASDHYRRRVADEVREHLQGNPCWF